MLSESSPPGEVSGGSSPGLSETMWSEEPTETGAAMMDMSVSVESELGASLFVTETLNFFYTFY